MLIADNKLYKLGSLSNFDLLEGVEIGIWEGRLKTDLAKCKMGKWEHFWDGKCKWKCNQVELKILMAHKCSPSPSQHGEANSLVDIPKQNVIYQNTDY